MKLCLIRHGETDYNREDRMQGKRAIELSTRGLQEAGDLGKALKAAGIKPQKIFSSPLKRAHDTAVHLNFQVPIITDEAFAARNLGQIEGLTKPEIAELFPGVLEKLLHWDFYPPGGDESLGDIFRRADARIDALKNVEPHQDPVCVVTHSGVLEALVRGWLHLVPTQPLPFPLKNAGALLFHWSDAQTGPSSNQRKTTGTWVIGQNIVAGNSSRTDHS